MARPLEGVTMVVVGAGPGDLDALVAHLGGLDHGPETLVVVPTPGAVGLGGATDLADVHLRDDLAVHGLGFAFGHVVAGLAAEHLVVVASASTRWRRGSLAAACRSVRAATPGSGLMVRPADLDDGVAVVARVGDLPSHAEVSRTAGLAPSAAGLVAALAADVAATGAAVVRCDPSDAVPIDERPLRPLIVTVTRGRAGTTLVMQLLGTSPRVAFDRQYPFEHRYLEDLIRRLDPLARSPDDGGHPFEPWLTGGDREAYMLEATRWGWEGLAALVRGRHDGPVQWYAEKSSYPFDHHGFRGIASRGIYTVRDPRDQWVSMNAFDERRGFYGFGRTDGQSRSDFLDVILDQLDGRLRAARGDDPAGEHLLVRYEDLVGDLARQARRLSAWLDVDLDASAVETSRADMTHHITSTSVESSVGRWRDQLPAEEEQRIWDRLGDVLDALGYQR